VPDTDFDAFTPPAPPARRGVSRALIAMIALVVLGVGVAGFGVFGLAQYRAFTLSASKAMGKTFEGASNVLITSADVADIHRGDLIVMDLSAFPDGAHGVVVKRVIGVGGDTVSCCDDQGRTQLNGKSVTESYLSPMGVSTDGFAPYSVKVPSGRFFVAGDQRDNSVDSRLYLDGPANGTVPMAKVLGVVVATGSVFSPQPLTPTTAFTDAGLEGAPIHDESYLLDRILVIAGLVLLLAGIIGVFVSVIRSGGKRRLPV
jgi:signal peptidase I